MGKITRRGGPSVREFASPAYVLRQRGKLGPYGGEAKVETFTAASEAAVVPHPHDASDEPDPTPDVVAGVGQAEPKPAEVRAWAREHGYEVAVRGKLAPEVAAAYKAAHAEG